MEMIAEITDADFGIDHVIPPHEYRIRKAARAVILNPMHEIALLYVAKKHVHKLPGGGIEQGENVSDALVRETMEEVGVEIETLADIGMIIEYRGEQGLLQISYCFLAHTVQESGSPAYTDEEREDGFVLRWVPVDEALPLLEQDQPSDYTSCFIHERDIRFLQKHANIYFQGRSSHPNTMQRECES